MDVYNSFKTGRIGCFFSAKSISAKVIITVMYDCISPIKTADSLTFNVRWFLELYIICLIT